MDPKEIKTNLKLARDHINNKQFKDALLSCKNILKHDKTNYNALVFAGYAAEGFNEEHQAITAYNRAIDVQPMQSLAWQGLATIYEKKTSDEDKLELLNIYNKLAAIFKNENNLEKRLNYLLKFVNLQVTFKKYQDAILICNEINEISIDNDILIKSYDILYYCACQITGFSENVIENTLKRLIEISPDKSIHYLIELAKFYKQHHKIEKLEKCLETFNASNVNDEVLCIKVDLIMYKLCFATIANTIALKDLQDNIKPFMKSTDYISLLEPIILYCENKYLDCCECFPKALKHNSENISAWIIYSNSLVFIKNFMSAVKACQFVISLLDKYEETKKVFKEIVIKQMVNCLFVIGGEKNLSDIHQLVNDIINESNDREYWIIVQTKLLLKNKHAGEIETFLLNVPSEFRNLPDVISINAHLEFLRNDLKKSLKILDDGLQQYPNHSKLMTIYGKILFVQLNYDGALKHFIEAVQVERNNSELFLYLGYCFEKRLSLEQAKSCFKRAFELDKYDSESGQKYFDLLIYSADDKSLNEGINILQRFTENEDVANFKWAWIRLGMLHMLNKNAKESIRCFQNAVKVDENDRYMWECLGDAYYLRGSYISALKSFQKAHTIENSAIYPLNKCAAISQLLYQYKEAISEYKEILMINHEYIPALKGKKNLRFLSITALKSGLGECYIKLAQDAIKDFFDSRALIYCETAIVYLTKCIHLKVDGVCVWKLFGDAFSILYCLSFSRMNIPQQLIKQNADEDVTVTISKRDVFLFAEKSYAKAISLNRNCSALYHDLATNYFRFANWLDVDVSKKKFMLKSLECFQIAVNLNSNCCQHWFSLGTVAISDEIDDPALAQHCFIKALQIEPTNCIAWTNLGLLYLQKENIELAHESFKRAQAADPSYTQAWIGQAFIAQFVSESDAMDLFRHTTSLDNHIESHAGYGSWVCKTILETSTDCKSSSDSYNYSINKMNAIPRAVDVLKKYILRMPDDVLSLNNLALLLERQKINKEASRIIRDSYENLGELSGNLSSIITWNCARILIKIGEYDTSLSLMNSISNDNPCKRYIMDCYEAYVLLCLKRNKECITVMRNALLKCTDKKDKINLQLIQIKFFYEMKNFEKCEILLNELLLEFKNNSINELLEISCAFALLTKNKQLFETAMNIYNLKDKSSRDLSSFFKSVGSLKFEETFNHKFHREFSIALHFNPLNIQLMTFGCQLLLKEDATHSNQSAIALIHNKEQLNEDNFPFDKMNSMLLNCLASLSAGYHSQGNGNNNVYKLAQKFVHLYPHKIQHWALLSAAIHGQNVINLANSQNLKKEDINKELNIITFVMVQVESNDELSNLNLWVVKMYIIALLIGKQYEQAKQFLEQALWLYDSDELMKSISAFLSENIKVLSELASKYSLNSFVLQLLINLLLKLKLHDELKFILKNCNMESSLVVAHTWKTILNIQSTSDIISINDSSVMQCASLLNMLQSISFIKNKKYPKTFLNNVISTQERCNTGLCASFARTLLLKILIMKQDETAIQILLDNALEYSDFEVLQFYKNHQLKNKITG